MAPFMLFAKTALGIEDPIKTFFCLEVHRGYNSSSMLIDIDLKRTVPAMHGERLVLPSLEQSFARTIHFWKFSVAFFDRYVSRCISVCGQNVVI